ncbi:MAG: hypothetical protein ABSG91_01820 [Syntrophobacteraceae bacterium]|jgi:hypothetical protein
MTNRNGEVWEERQTRDWFWIEKEGERYFSSTVITCVEAVRIIQGQERLPRTCHEVKDIGRFEPVSTGVIKLLTKAVNGLNVPGEGLGASLFWQESPEKEEIVIS